MVQIGCASNAPAQEWFNNAPLTIQNEPSIIELI